VVNFDQTYPGATDFVGCSVALEEIMAVPKNDKHREYVRYAEHCLDLVPSVADQDSRAINREMAAEWLRLADAIAHPLKRMT
jgi:hypothetical protein